MKNITFRYQPPIASKLDIYLVGDFNNWNKTSHKFVEHGGNYEVSLNLSPGEYKYYLLINGKATLDPNAESLVVDDVRYSLVKVIANDEYIYIVPFKIKDNLRLEEVSIVGDFNHWKPNHNPLYQEKEFFVTTLFLPEGLYHYKYLAKGNRWFNESEIESKIDKSAFDNKSNNSSIDTKKGRYLTINRDLLASCNSNKLVMKRDVINIYRYSEHLFEFKAIFPNISGVKVEILVNNEIYEMDFVASDGNRSAYSKMIELENLELVYSYQLKLYWENVTFYASKRTLTNNPNSSSIFVPSNQKIFSICEDLGKRIMYQIMPDRFYNGDQSLNPDFQEEFYSKAKQKPNKGKLSKNQEYYHMAKWDDIAILTENPYSEDKEADWFVFYGGDLKGVQAKIPYLLELGVSLIYLNPIFTAKSPHRYDTIDFRSVDPHLGGNESFQSLVDVLHQHDIKVIIDIALNHCGIDFFAFKDTIEKGKDSEYWSWFDWKKWPLPNEFSKSFQAEEYYQCWWGIKDLPEFNYDLLRQSPEENLVTDIQQAKPNTELVNYLLDSMKFWVETVKVDGFRLDVPEEVPFWFWKLFRAMLDKINPDIYLVGEIWNDSQVWLEGEYFDAVMNYHSFKDPCVAYFIQDSISLKSFVNTISSGLIDLPGRVLRSQMNLLSSHDTIRIRNLADGNVNKIKLALIFQFTFVGIPHIYYGDEVFLDGNKDPDNRRPFPWDFNNDSERVELLAFYKQLIKIRIENKLFTEGNIKFIEHQHLLVYERWQSDSKQKAIVIINKSNSPIKIENFIKMYPKKLLHKLTDNFISESGYYLATT